MERGSRGMVFFLKFMNFIILSITIINGLAIDNLVIFAVLEEEFPVVGSLRLDIGSWMFGFWGGLRVRSCSCRLLLRRGGAGRGGMRRFNLLWSRNSIWSLDNRLSDRNLGRGCRLLFPLNWRLGAKPSR